MNERRRVVVKLTDGPCAGDRATVLAFGDELWQRLSNRDQVWCRYVKNLFAPGEYVWAGEARTTEQQASAMRADEQNTYATSEAT